MPEREDLSEPTEPNATVVWPSTSYNSLQDFLTKPKTLRRSSANALLRPKFVWPHFVILMISVLGCSWPPLPPCLRSLSPSMGSVLGGSCLPLQLPSLSPFMISSLGCLSMGSVLGCSCLPLHLPSLSPFMVQFWAALGRCYSSLACPQFWAALGRRYRLVSEACLPPWVRFWAALVCHYSSLACLPSWFQVWAVSPWVRFWAALVCHCTSPACLPSWFSSGLLLAAATAP